MKKVENPIIADNHPIPDMQQADAPIVGHCNGCGDEIYEYESRYELDHANLIAHHDDDCLSAILKRDAKLIVK